VATEVEKIVLAGTDDHDLTKLAEYEAVGGYRALTKARAMTPQDVTEELITSELRGRGGAFFPTGRKWSFVPSKEQIPKPHYLVVNADESEPGSFKDNEILSRVPHRFIEGYLITAHAIDCDKVFVYIRGEYSGPYEILVSALEELKDRPELRGEVTIVVHRGAGAYICGEETALLDSLEGKRGNPRLKPPFPAVQGLYDGPTLINNVETLSNAPHIIASGAEWFRSLGTEQSPGTKVVSVSGDVQRPGNYEIELGIETKRLINGLAGGPLPGRKIKGIFPGGSSSPVLLPEECLDVPYSFEAMQEAGSMLGSGSIIVFDETTSVVELALRTARFYHHESCGKCTPCREGTNWTVKMLERMIRGEATPIDLETVASVQTNIIGNCLCVLGDSMAIPIGSMVKKFRDEFTEAIQQGVPERLAA